MSATAITNVSAGSTLTPVVRADGGDEVTPSDTVVYDSANVSQVTYVCKGTTLDFSCKPGPPPLPAKNVTVDIGKFILGFSEGLGQDLNFSDCIQDVNKSYEDIRAIVDFFEAGINHKTPTAIAKAFELVGDMLKDFSAAIQICAKDVTKLVAQIKGLASALSGNVYDIIKIIVKDAVHIYHERAELTDDCKTTTCDWAAGDYTGAGKAVGDIVGIIINGLDKVKEPDMLVV